MVSQSRRRIRNKNETQTTEDKKDEPIKQDEAPPHSGQRGRRPSVFEEGLKEFL